MQFEALIRALRSGNKSLIDAEIAGYFEVMVGYLISRMQASPDDAQDAAQQTILKLLEQGENQQIKCPSKSAAYVLAVLKNEYLKIIRKSYSSSCEPIEKYMNLPSGPDQHDLLIDNERIILLKECIEQMTEKNKAFIALWMTEPFPETVDVAEHFGISVSNAWTMKHRIIKWLNNCLNRKMGTANEDKAIK